MKNRKGKQNFRNCDYTTNPPSSSLWNASPFPWLWPVYVWTPPPPKPNRHARFGLIFPHTTKWTNWRRTEERKILRITEEKKPKIQDRGDEWNRTMEQITTSGGPQVKRLKEKREKKKERRKRQRSWSCFWLELAWKGIGKQASGNLRLRLSAGCLMSLAEVAFKIGAINGKLWDRNSKKERTLQDRTQWTWAFLVLSSYYMGKDRKFKVAFSIIV